MIKYIKKDNKSYCEILSKKHAFYNENIKDIKKKLEIEYKNVLESIKKSESKYIASKYVAYNENKEFVCEINQNFNFGLIMDKYNFSSLAKNKESFKKGKNLLDVYLENNIFNNYNLDILNQNKKDIIKSFSDTHKNISLELRTLDKLIIGIGDSGVNDYAMTLNHTYGIPYIPASAFKGCLRHYFEGSKLKNLNILLGSNENDNENASISNIIFLDSYPLNSYNIKMDVITSHTNNKKNPIFFPVVRDTIFKFDILIDKNILKKIKIDEKYKDLKNINIEKTLEKSIEHMLIDCGIGAKSSSGYGYFRCINK